MIEFDMPALGIHLLTLGWDFWIKALAINDIKHYKLRHGKNHPFLVRFGLNLGLNNLKFGQEAIFDLIESI